MSRDPWSKALRVAGADPLLVAAALADAIPIEGLQHAGGAILSTEYSDDLASITSRLVDALGERRWTGDPELGTDLDHYMRRTESELKPLQIDLADLAEMALNESAGREAYIDVAGGTLWPAIMLDDGMGPDDFDPDESDRWLYVEGLGSSAAYEVMRRFVSTVEHPDIASPLRDALVGRGAFQRFQKTLSRFESEYTRWHVYRDDAQLGQARAWLADRGYRSVDRPVPI